MTTSNGVKKIIKITLFCFLILLLFLVWFTAFGTPPAAEKISWGVNFSQKHAELLGLDWQEVYLALFDDLGVRSLKLITHWDLIEPDEGEYNFEDLDWQIKEAENFGAKVLLVIGMKTGRWPECHIPEWAENLNQEQLQERILELIKEIVLRYQSSPSIAFWQVENEPFFPFGECPKIDKDFLKKEIELVRELDPTRPMIISDSGEFSLWIQAAKLGDIVATTLHRKVWFKEFHFYVSYPFRPVYYWRKAQIIKKLFNKEVICGELQTEPWCPVLLYDCSPKEQKKTMDLERFRKNIEYARQTGLGTSYLWGAEWWYWMREKQQDPQIWNEAKKLF